MQKSVQIIIKLFRWHISVGQGQGGADCGDFNGELKTRIRQGARVTHLDKRRWWGKGGQLWAKYLTLETGLIPGSTH